MRIPSRPASRLLVPLLACALSANALAVHAQRAALPVDPAAPNPHRIHLILKDGSYQVVTSYKILKDRVQYRSAERAGQTEEIPLDLVDLSATRAWEKQHSMTPEERAAEDQRNGPPVLDPELAKEEADRAAITPEVASNLRLPAEDTLLALDTFQGAPELIPLEQQHSELNRQTGHSILRGIVNPRSATHPVAQLKGEKADVQLHVQDPVLYLRLDDAMPASGEVMTIDTHGHTPAPDKPHDKNDTPGTYAIVRLDVRQDARIVTSFQASLLGSERQPDVTETVVTPLPGNHWAKIVPKTPLLIGEYALVEVLGEKEINLGVWDFGIHPTAPENRDALLPEKKRPSTLERRGP
jgi:hypothetical protein